MDVNRIPTEIVEKLAKKYGQKQLRKYLNYYSSGLPETYWQDINTDNGKDFNKLVDENSNVVVLSDTVSKSDKIVYNYVKRCIDSGIKCKAVDFISLNSKLVDKFGQINLDVLNEYSSSDVLLIVGFKRYGKVYDKFYPAISSILNSLIHSSIFSKKIIMSIESKTESLDDLAESFGDEFTDMIINDFEIFSIVGVK